MKVKTLCPYCGVGCSFFLKVENNKVIRVEPWDKDPLSNGKPCIKGLSCYESIYKDRVKYPMIREKGRLKKVSWKESYEYIYQNLRHLNKEQISFYGSSPASNEDNYLLQKLGREVFKTENIDSCARLCHAATCFAFFNSFGIGRMPSKIEDFEKADLIMIIGSNPKVTYPVAFNKIKGNIIVVSPWREESAENNIYVKIEDGTDLAFLNGVLNLSNLKVPKKIKEVISKYDKETVERICKVNGRDLNKVINLIINSKNFVLGFGMGLTQHVYGVNNIHAAINLVLAKKGKIISMRGKTNIQGVGDMGCLPRKGGKTIIESVFFDKVKALYIMESNPAQSLPDLNKTHRKMRDMFIVIHTSYPNLTMKKFANVILPCCSWAERSGSYTNAESRIRWFNKAVEPLYESKPNWKILLELSKYFGKNWKYKDEKGILKEITKRVKGYNLDMNKIINNGCFVNYKVLKREFKVVDYLEVEDNRNEEYPFLLTTARLPYQFCTGEMSNRSRTLNKMNKEALCLMNKSDAKELKIVNGSRVKIISKVGQIDLNVKLDNRIPKKLLIVPFHFENVLVNRLIPLEISPLVEEPNLKKVAVRIGNV